MKELFDHWKAISLSLRKAPRRLCIFDFDGTLVPIAPSAVSIRMDPHVRELLGALARQPETSVGIVSGRQLIDLQRWIRLPDVTYAGNQGLEWRHGSRRWVHPLAKKHSGLLRRLKAALQKSQRDIPGHRLENKILTLGVHIRGVAARLRSTARARVRRIVDSAPYRGKFMIYPSKLAMEIVPRVGWDKGSVVKTWTHQEPRGTAVFYTGDDVNDEAAFRAVQPRGIAIRVGHRKNSDASYYLRSQRSVPGLLERLVHL